MTLESLAIYAVMGILIASIGFGPSTLVWWCCIALIVAKEYVSTRRGLLQGRMECLYLMHVAQKDITKANTLCMALTGIDPKTIITLMGENK